MTVIGPYSSSAEAINNLIGCLRLVSDKLNGKHRPNLAQIVCMIQHRVCRSPASISMKGDLERGGDPALNLQLLKILNTLSG
jgi:hypothetical protein